jgi:hypothetical protein
MTDHATKHTYRVRRRVIKGWRLPTKRPRILLAQIRAALDRGAFDNRRISVKRSAEYDRAPSVPSQSGDAPLCGKASALGPSGGLKDEPPRLRGRASRVQGRTPRAQGRASKVQGRTPRVQGRAPRPQSCCPMVQGRAARSQSCGPMIQGRASRPQTCCPSVQDRAPRPQVCGPRS